jgi:hypothetical protein
MQQPVFLIAEILLPLTLGLARRGKFNAAGIEKAVGCICVALASDIESAAPGARKARYQAYIYPNHLPTVTIRMM